MVQNNNIYKIIERYFVYDENDKCVSTGFVSCDSAYEHALDTGNPTVKLYRFYYDADMDRNGILMPYGQPEVVWQANQKHNNKERE